MSEKDSTIEATEPFPLDDAGLEKVDQKPKTDQGLEDYRRNLSEKVESIKNELPGLLEKLSSKQRLLDAAKVSHVIQDLETVVADMKKAIELAENDPDY